MKEKMEFKLGDLVRKKSGSSWHGKIVGTYSTELTPEGYAVESMYEPGSVQIYPAKALEAIQGQTFETSEYIEIRTSAFGEVRKWAISMSEEITEPNDHEGLMREYMIGSLLVALEKLENPDTDVISKK